MLSTEHLCTTGCYNTFATLWKIYQKEITNESKNKCN